MKRTISIALLLSAFVFTLPAQNNDFTLLKDQVVKLEDSNAKLLNQVRVNQKAITNLTNQLNATNETLKLIQADLGKTQTSLQEVSTAYDTKIAKTEQTATEQFTHLGKSLANNTIFWIIAFLVVAVAVFFVYRMLRSRLSKEKATLIEIIKSGNEQIKSDMSGLINKNADDIRVMFTGDLKSNNEQMTGRFNKANEELRNDIKGNLKLATEAFEEQKAKLENQIKALTEEVKKGKTAQPQV